MWVLHPNGKKRTDCQSGYLKNGISFGACHRFKVYMGACYLGGLLGTMLPNGNGLLEGQRFGRENNYNERNLGKISTENLCNHHV